MAVSRPFFALSSTSFKLKFTSRLNMIMHDGIKVEFRIGDAAIPEYMVEKDLAQKRVTCWIPSQTGKEFQILVTHERQGDLSVNVTADGIVAQIPVLYPFEKRNVAFYRESLTERRSFIFTKLDLVDDDSLLDASGCLQVGEIKLFCEDLINVEKCSGTFNDTTKQVANKKVHERAKKGVDVHIGLGGAILCKTPTTFVKGKQSEHVITFVFRYRPLDYLQAQGIVPIDVAQQRASSVADTTLDKRFSTQEGPVSDARGPGTKVDGIVKEEYAPEDEDDDDIKALLTIAKEMKAKAEKMRAQKRKNKTDEAPRKKVKKEDSLPAFLSGQIIDLT